jgi:hypothetical protein
MSKSRYLVLLAVPSLVLVVGCSEAARYNNAIVGVAQELEASGRHYGEQLNQHAGNRAKIKELHAETVREVEDIVKRARKIQVPKLKKARELHQAFLHFLTVQERLVRNDFSSIGYEIGRGNRSSAFQTVMRLQKWEQAEIKKLQAAQKAFAEANNLTFQLPK